MGDATFSSLPIRCSTDKVTWFVCGSVFHGVPAWVKQRRVNAETGILSTKDTKVYPLAHRWL
jgi:hypothetical protein